MRRAALIDSSNIVVNVIIYPEDDLPKLYNQRLLKDNSATELVFVTETTGNPFIGLSYADGIFEQPPLKPDPNEL